MGIEKQLYVKEVRNHGSCECESHICQNRSSPVNPRSSPCEPSCCCCSHPSGWSQSHLWKTYPYVSPFPYKEKHFYWFSQFFGNAKKRMCENSKIITVDGNFGVGKDEFAKRLAKEFDLQYIPAVPDKQCFDKDGYNLLELNQFLPEERMKLYDWEAFLKDKNYK